MLTLSIAAPTVANAGPDCSVFLTVIIGAMPTNDDPQLQQAIWTSRDDLSNLLGTNPFQAALAQNDTLTGQVMTLGGGAGLPTHRGGRKLRVITNPVCEDVRDEDHTAWLRNKGLEPADGRARPRTIHEDSGAGSAAISDAPSGRFTLARTALASAALNLSREAQDDDAATDVDLPDPQGGAGPMTRVGMAETSEGARYGFAAIGFGGFAGSGFGGFGDFSGPLRLAAPIATAQTPADFQTPVSTPPSPLSPLDPSRLVSLVSPAPEPGTWSIMLLGFGAVGAMMRAGRGRAAIAWRSGRGAKF